MSAPGARAPEERAGFTVLLVPDRSGRSVRQFRVEPGSLRALRSSAIGAAAALVLLLGALGLALPRVLAYGRIREENDALRARLASIDDTLDDMDDALRRMRLHDAQIRHLARGADLPGWGPLDEEEEQHWAELWGAEDPPGEDAGKADPAQAEREIGSNGVGALDIRPAELWAQAVESRATELAGMAGALEPRLAALVEGLEDWRTTRSSLPRVWPTWGVLSSEFGYRRSPFSRRWKFHSGIDIAGPRGSPVYASASGVVTFSGYNQGYGRMIEIDHGHGVHTRYAHNTAQYVAEGEVVDAGERIAAMGSTGRTTGPHLHFELLIDGEQVDPIEYLP